jgi:hypothetical protein
MGGYWVERVGPELTRRLGYVKNSAIFADRWWAFWYDPIDDRRIRITGPNGEHDFDRRYKAAEALDEWCRKQEAKDDAAEVRDTGGDASREV